MKEELLPLDQKLVEHPYEFDFFQAVRLLGVIMRESAAVGGSFKPHEEIVRFKARQSLEFPASAIYNLNAEPDPPEMVVTFFGLTGIQGVLPLHYTEHLLGRAVSKDYAMAAFFDIFNHRLISLFYCAWEKHRLPVLYQMAAVRNNAPDRITGYLFDLIGMGTLGLRGRMCVRDEGLLRYAGLLAQTPRCSSALAGILRDYFGIPVEIDEFIGEWYELKAEDITDLLQPAIRNALGDGAIAGDEVWGPQARFRVRLGPLPLAQFLMFLPGGAAVDELVELVRFYAGDVMRFEWQPILQADEVPWCRLGEHTAASPKLSECAWLKTEEFTSDAEQAVFSA
jgi:type VI secretion system protein ImpH